MGFPICKPHEITTGQASIPMYGAGGVDPTTHATLVAERDAGHGPTDALFGSLEDIPRGAARQMDGSIYNQEKRLELPSEKYGKGHGSALSMEKWFCWENRNLKPRCCYYSIWVFAHMFPKHQSIEITLQTFAIVLANFQVFSGGVTPGNNGFVTLYLGKKISGCVG